ncbi:hypothetical protein PACTADRAFT_47990 [Pachysolen tannophilus NRRL Y-2460]|uniref:Protein CCC1 n=1 Tax=Pachysolen tannophilus NRRL Y-2460 TaxID=669874 RepID=A0A1E4TMT8_PACTA|nr:hypothetical protein PACTADRAFT_52191 [Pachysolen tannophilus NRRL Y-2460]ODV98187.1 hypothetical protein PACTADRAFT_47990 [Pachysolen tannophilus NRRL Y-2460]
MSLVALKNSIAAVINPGNDSIAKQPLTNSTTREYYGSTSDYQQDQQQQQQQQGLAASNRISSLDEENNLEQTLSSSSESKKSQEDSVFGGLFTKVDPRVMSDIIIGLSDGLTVPFALTAGLSSLGDSKLVITGGMAELVSGAISMGLGGFLAARSESEYYKSEVKKEKQAFFEKPEMLADEVYDIMLNIGAKDDTIELFLRDLEKSPKTMIDFIIRFGRGLEEPADGRQLTSALTIGLSYFFGGFVPLIPYFFTHTVRAGLLCSIILMGFTLFWFGYIKTVVSLGNDVSLYKKTSEGVQMFLIGSIAASAAFGLVYLIE